MKSPAKSKLQPTLDPDPYFRFEWKRLPDGRFTSAVSIAMTRRNLRWLVPSAIATVTLYKNSDKLGSLLPVLKHLLPF